MFLRAACITMFLGSLFVYKSTVFAMSPPDEVVKNTVTSVIGRIQQDKSALAAMPDKLYALFDELIIPSFDFISMSQLILGSHWKTATDMQRTEFVAQFKTMLVNTYAEALLKYSDRDISFSPVVPSDRKNLAVVKTALAKAGTQPFTIAYRMYQKNGEWKVIDITMDGVSLVTTYRGSFDTQIKKSSFDSLLQHLAEKNSNQENDLKTGNR